MTKKPRSEMSCQEMSEEDLREGAIIGTVIGLLFGGLYIVGSLLEAAVL